MRTDGVKGVMAGGLGLGFRNLEGHAFGNADLRFASMR